MVLNAVHSEWLPWNINNRQHSVLDVYPDFAMVWAGSPRLKHDLFSFLTNFCKHQFDHKWNSPMLIVPSGSKFLSNRISINEPVSLFYLGRSAPELLSWRFCYLHFKMLYILSIIAVLYDSLCQRLTEILIHESALLLNTSYTIVYFHLYHLFGANNPYHFPIKIRSFISLWRCTLTNNNIAATVIRTA